MIWERERELKQNVQLFAERAPHFAYESRRSEPSTRCVVDSNDLRKGGVESNVGTVRIALLIWRKISRPGTVKRQERRTTKRRRWWPGVGCDTFTYVHQSTGKRKATFSMHWNPSCCWFQWTSLIWKRVTRCPYGMRCDSACETPVHRICGRLAPLCIQAKTENSRQGLADSLTRSVC